MKQANAKAGSARGRKPKENNNKKSNRSSGEQVTGRSRQTGSRGNGSRENGDRGIGSRDSAGRNGTGRGNGSTPQGRSTRSQTGERASATRQTGSQARKGQDSSNQGGAKSQGGEESPKGAPLEKFFLDQLQDIYYAEQKIVQALPKMHNAATTDELKDAFEDHLYQTQRHVSRLEKVFETVGKKAEGKKCEAIEGIIREAESIIAETQEGTLTRDAALIIAAQKVEHYEIATYGGLLQLAITMGLYDAAELLDRTLIEEEDTDSLLTEIAENDINLGAECEGNDYWLESVDITMEYEPGTDEGEEEDAKKQSAGGQETSDSPDEPEDAEDRSEEVNYQ